MRTLIQNGLVVTDGKRFFSDVLVEDGTILRVAPNLSDTADRVIDAAGCYVMAGFIDTHTHFDLDLGCPLGNCRR